MTKPKADKRLTPITIIMEWLGVVALHCSTNSSPTTMASPMKLMASELSLSYPESSFSEASAKAVAMDFQYGWPTIVQMRKALDAWRKHNGGEGSSGSKIFLSDDRLQDPRVASLTPEEKTFLAFYDRRYLEVVGEEDPLWESLDDRKRLMSKRGNLASFGRTHGKNAWPIIARPFGEKETAEAEFLRLRYDNPEPRSEENPEEFDRQRAAVKRILDRGYKDQKPDPRRQMRSSDEETYGR